jgi:hypothetical protein
VTHPSNSLLGHYYIFAALTATESLVIECGIGLK